MKVVPVTLLVLSLSYLSLSALHHQSPWDPLGLRLKRSFHHPMAFRRESRLPSFHPDLRGSGLRGMRRKRSEVVSQMTDCMTVSSNEEGVWEYVSDGGQTRHVTGPRYLYSYLRQDGNLRPVPRHIPGHVDRAGDDRHQC